jgi:peptidyl-prolyl cis-trans isomerase A (cyclophilin A)
MKNHSVIVIAALACTVSLMAQTAPKKVPAKGTRAAAPRPSLLNPASLKARAPETYRAKVTTTKGDFVVEVTRAWAPLGADRFFNLVQNGYYTNAAFFRVLPGFVAQVGISARPEVSRVWAGARIADDQVKESNLRGYVTFATSGPNSRTTQIFINLADNTGLDGMGFAPFGKVVEGMEVVEQFHSGYGEGPPRGRGPDQGRITNEGKAYLDRDFPQLDSTTTAVVLPANPPSAGSAPRKPAATPKPVTPAKETK